LAFFFLSLPGPESGQNLKNPLDREKTAKTAKEIRGKIGGKKRGKRETKMFKIRDLFTREWG